MWADPLWQPDQWAPEPKNVPQPTLATVHQPERQAGPIAVIHLPKDRQHLVYPPRERIGFRRGS